MKKHCTLMSLHILCWALLVIDRLLLFFPPLSIAGPNGVSMSFSFAGKLYMLVFPILAFLLVEDFSNNKFFCKAAAGFLLLAILFEVPFDLVFNYTPFEISCNNIFFVLFMGAVALLIQSSSWSKITKLLTTAGLCILSCISNCDPGIGGILLVLLFYYTRSISHRRFVQLLGMLFIAWISLRLSLFGIITMITPGYIPFFHGHFINAQYFYVLSLIPISLLGTSQKQISKTFLIVLYGSLPLVYLGIYALRYFLKGF